MVREATAPGTELGEEVYEMLPLSRPRNQKVEEKGEAGAARELEILKVFAGRARKRIHFNINRIDDNDDEMVKSLADRAFDLEGFAWDAA